MNQESAVRKHSIRCNPAMDQTVTAACSWRSSFARFPESGGRAGVTVNKLHGEVNLTHVLPNSETHLVAKESCCRVLGRGHG